MANGNKQRIVIIGANEFQLPLVEAARRQGLETHVFAWEAGAVAKDAADFFYPVSIVEMETILKLAEPLRPAAVATIGSDLAAITVNYLAERLGLPGNPPETAFLATNKPAMREAFRAAGLYTPRFVKLAKGDKKWCPEGYRQVEHSQQMWLQGEGKVWCPMDASKSGICSKSGCREEEFDGQTFAGWQWPLIVKPVDRSGSRGVTRVEDESQLPAALELAFACSFSREAIVEEFIEGEEFSCEGISFEGHHRLLQVTKKYTTEAPSYIEKGHLASVSLTAALRERVEATVFQALNALHIQNGASHTEIRIRPTGEVCLIEAAARMGGDCIGSDLVPLTTGCDYVGMVLDTALGREPDTARQPFAEAAGIRFVFNEKDLQKVQQAIQERPACVVKQFLHVGELKNQPQDSSTRHGFCIFRGDETWLRNLLE